MREEKRYRMVFRAKTNRYKRRVIRCACTEEELQGMKEHWAMVIEEELGSPVECIEIEEVNNRRTQ